MGLTWGYQQKEWGLGRTADGGVRDSNWSRSQRWRTWNGSVQAILRGGQWDFQVYDFNLKQKIYFTTCFKIVFLSGTMKSLKK